MTRASPAKVPHVAWTTAEQARLRDLYPNTPMPVLVVTFKRAATAIYVRARLLGLKRSSAFLASPHSGRAGPGRIIGTHTRFQPRG